ncbi:MAG: hypothetical protein LBT41_04600 [Candidatus Methanoplasma sp.]|jgi:hypothetical protein|nr:hypothetical protein [Candidatus Methanoplasma sp.]
MYANANKYELRMPVKYRDLKEEEMEYEGGFIWSIALSVVGWSATIVGNVTNNNALKAVGDAITVIGLISNPLTVGFGVAKIVTAKTAAEIAAKVTPKVIGDVAYGSTIGALDNVVGAGSLCTDKF